MDPFTVATGVTQLIALADTVTTRLLQFISFIRKVRSIPEYIEDIHGEITALKGTLIQVNNTLQTRAQRLPFERSHHAVTNKIIQSCNNSLKQLEKAIPELKDGSGILKCVWKSVEHSFNEGRIRQISERIGSDKSLLNISLSTLVLLASGETSSSQQVIQTELQKLRNLVQSSPFFSTRTGYDELVRAQAQSTSTLGDGLENSILEKELIRDWHQTVDDVASGVSISDSMSCDTRSVAPGSSVSVDAPTLYEKFDPEPDLPDEQHSEILTRFYLNENQDFVKEFRQGEMFVKASLFQRKGIAFMKQLLETQGTALSENASSERLADMEEELADILLQCNNDKNSQEAIKILERLLDEEIKRADQMDNDRRARLYHKLGELYYKRGSIDQARLFLDRAFNSRQGIEPKAPELVEETAELLAEVFGQDQAPDKANGLRKYIRQMLPQDTRVHVSSTSVTDLVTAYQWCKEKGINADIERFRFSDHHPVLETTPMHQAVRDENIDVLRIMLSSEGYVERSDKSGSTLLHAAAATRNYHICKLLLERSADPFVFDRSGMTPLHRCQSVRGGVKVARILLEKCHGLLNHANSFGKTALYMACEKGNVPMVEFLLAEAKADPNRQGPGQRTPLITTIDDVVRSDYKIAIVRLLINHGADPWMSDADSRTAVVAANNIGLAGDVIKPMLNKVPRRASSATVKTTTSSSDDGRRSNRDRYTM